MTTWDSRDIRHHCSSHQIPSPAPLLSPPPAHAFPHPVDLLLPGFVSLDPFPFSLHEGCWSPPGLLSLLIGCSELREGLLESDIYLHHPCVLLMVPTRHGCPIFLFSLLLLQYDLDKRVVGPSHGHRATSRQGAWPPWQMQQPVTTCHPPEDKKVHPEPTRDAQMS